MNKLQIFSFLLFFFIASSYAKGQRRDPAALDPGFVVTSGASACVFTSVLQFGDHVIIGGDFTSYNNVAVNRIVRLDSKGEIDNSFKVGTGADGLVFSIELQADGAMIIGGAFNNFNGFPMKGIVKLNADGTVDNTFNAGGSGVDFYIKTTATQPDGKILIGGYFTKYNGVAWSCLARLNADGTLDNTFNVGSGLDLGSLIVSSFAIQSDGKIIVTGSFDGYNGTLANKIVRLNSDGSRDYSFDIGTGFDETVSTTVIQPNGKILVGGDFKDYNGFPVSGIALLNTDGTLDNTFNTGGSGVDNFIETIVPQSDGKILIGGNFFNYNGVLRSCIVRLNSDGSLDTSFGSGSSGAFGSVFKINIQADGKIILVGDFTMYNGIGIYRIARLNGNSPFNVIAGNIYNDVNNDCQIQSVEKNISSVFVKATPGPYYGITDNDGRYEIKVDSGSYAYTLTQEFNSSNSKIFFDKCTSFQSVVLKGSSLDTCCFDFADSIKQCSLLNINIQNTRLRRCIRNNTFVEYCNHGGAAASGVKIKIEYPSYVIPISSIPMWSSKEGSVLIYDIGMVAEDYCGKIFLIDSVACENEIILGLTQCIKATISPAYDCIAEDPGWDGSTIRVTGEGLQDSTRFVVENEGTGDMSAPRDCRIYVEDTLIYQQEFYLKANERFVIEYPNEGQTIRVEADQDPLHPGKGRPRAIVENSLVSPSFIPGGHVVTSPQDDLDEEVAVTCNFIRDSYDPNDKQVIPCGIGVANQIAPGEELEYTIRFQNTGTDTAYSIKVVDTLDTALAVGSFVKGASSHPYTLDVTGKGQAVITFNFNHINLPDSATNKAGSNGLVSYRITIPASTPIGTMIHNKAYIYFDYNSPILTNETMHTVGVAIPEDLSKGSKVHLGEVTTGLQSKYNNSRMKLYPNPSSGWITIETPFYGDHMELKIVSILGIVQKSIPLGKTNIHEVNLEGIKQGMYVYEIWQEGERKSAGMVQLR